MGFWTDITDIQPLSAEAGATVPLEVTVENKGLTQFTVIAGYYNSGALPQVVAEIQANQTHVFETSFVMPDHGITVQIWTYIWVIYPDQPGYWQEDDFKSVNIVIMVGEWLLVAETTFSLTKGITPPPPLEWMNVAGTNFTLTKGIIPLEEWMNVAGTNFTLMLGIGIIPEWMNVAGTNFTLAKAIVLPPPEEPPPEEPPPEEEKKNILPLVLIAGGAGVVALGLARKPKEKRGPT